MTLLTFKNKYVVQSSTNVTTNSTSFVDDTSAIQTFSLSSTQTVLVIYQSYGNHSGSIYGMRNAINIDGVDRAISCDSGGIGTLPVRNMPFWIGSLSAGSHTIKGRFSSNNTSYGYTIKNRILLIYIFDGNEFQYIDDSSHQVRTYSLADDPYAIITFTPSAPCKALYMYNCSNNYGTGEYQEGKAALINVAADYSQAEKSGTEDNSPDSIFTCYANSLTATSTTVKGRFKGNTSNWIYIDNRQLGVLLFDNSTLLDSITSDLQVSTNSNILVNDPQAIINRTTTNTKELLVVAFGTKRKNTSSNFNGEAYGISVDGNDKQISRCSAHRAAAPDRAESASTCWAQTLSSGTHTVQGRFSNNSGSDNAVFDSRRMFALWLSIPSGSLNISSTPSGASIYIDNVLQIGITTPAIITGISIGTHTLKLTLPNYFDLTDSFNITGGATTTLSETLIPNTGTLDISSTPSGARIYIDDIDQGIDTPNTISNLTPGSHNIKLTLTNYDDYITSVTIISNQTTTITPILSLSPGITKVEASPSFIQPSYAGEIIDIGTLKFDWIGTGIIILEKTIVYDRLVLTGPNGIFDHTWTPCGAIVPEGPFDITNIFIPGYNEINVKIYNICGGDIGTVTGSIDITGPITLVCPTIPKYSGDTVTLEATPKDGIGPYYVEFSKDGSIIDPARLGGLDNPIIDAPEDTTITRTYQLTDEDVRNALTGTITFSVFMSDSCPTTPQTCTQDCIVNIGCMTPVCNFTVT